MDLYGKYKSPFGYQGGDNGIDSYGVDHNNFTLRDEIEYQIARDNRESQMMQMYNQQGVTDNYPQYTTNFWGNAGNNYGFGNSNISQNISTHPAMNITPVPIQMPTALSTGLNNNQANFSGNNYTTGANTTIWQMNNNAGENITALNPINAGYQMGQRIGELAADTKLSYDYWQKMNQTGKQLVKTFGPGQGADIDNYYHPLLQCELAKISPQSRDNGIALGYAKEYLMDYPKKRFLKHQSPNEIMEDSRKDLKNNLYGSNLGYNNPNKSCEDLLDDRRTPNMRKLGIR